MNILTPASSPPQHIDGCPECVVNSEAPHTTERTPAGWTESYVCADCGHRWYTCWAVA
jgi:hypothetical protein